VPKQSPSKPQLHCHCDERSEEATSILHPPSSILHPQSSIFRLRLPFYYHLTPNGVLKMLIFHPFYCHLTPNGVSISTSSISFPRCFVRSPSSALRLPSSILHSPSSILHSPSSILHPQSSIFPPPPSGFQRGTHSAKIPLKARRRSEFRIKEMKCKNRITKPERTAWLA